MPATKRSAKNSKRGFTLIEVVAAIVIASFVIGVFASIISNGMRAWFFLKGQRNFMADSRGAIKRLVREVRRTKDITAFNSTQFTFRDVDNNTITYAKDGTIFKRDGASILEYLAPVDGVSFQYYDRFGNQTTSNEAIRVVQVTLKMQNGDNYVRLQSAARIRNR